MGGIAGVEGNSNDLRMQLADPLWRLENLYTIKSADEGRPIRFVPRPEQREIFEAIHVHKLRKVIILKARRLGMSTAIDVMAADLALFNAGLQISIVDQTQDDASKKLNGICKVAWEGLPDVFKQRVTVVRDNDSAWELRAGVDAPSSIYAGKNARGGTNQFLHVSEWGVIQADDPMRSEEILTGAIPSAEHGVVIVESTWKGGRGGHLWNLVREALEVPRERRGREDWHVFFFPWWRDGTYSESGDVDAIEPEVREYLDEKEGELGIVFTRGQRCWYARRRRMLGMFIWREFPTTMDECFRAPVEGAIYAGILDRLRVRGRLGACEVDASALVHTCWDLGSPLNTVTWFFQMVGDEIRVVDCDLDLDLTPVQRVGRILSRGYNLGFHYLPHDAGATQRSGRTFQQELEAAGLRNTRVVPVTQDVWIGINRARQLMERMVFALPRCERGVECLSNYHTRRESAGGLAKDEPVHDWCSHAADALRVLAEAEMAGMLVGGSSTAMRGRKNGEDRARVRMGFRGRL